MSRIAGMLSTAVALGALFPGCQSGQKQGSPEKAAEAVPAAAAAAATFPPEGVDHLGMAVELEVEIFGLGKDTVTLRGTVAVHRSGPTGDGGKLMKGVLAGASLRGKSEVFGDVVAVQSPTESTAAYAYRGPGDYTGKFSINGWFWLPEHGRVFYTKEPVVVEGPAKQIPPVGQVAKKGPGDVQLFDLVKKDANPVGVLTAASGEVLPPVRVGG